VLHRVSSIVAIICLLLSSGLAQGGFIPSNPAIPIAVDTANFNQDGMLAIFGSLRFGGDVGLPVGAGDINGDGRADVIYCAMYGSAGPGNRSNNGQVYFLLSDGRDSGFVDTSLNPPNLFSLTGADSGDLLGTSVSGNGDVNGDGVRDVVIGASADDGPSNSRFNSGAAYVVFGSTTFNLRADLNTLDGNPPPGVVAIYGPQERGRLGIWIDAGDIDGDGFADIVAGADQLNTAWGDHVGGAYIVFGSAQLPPVIDLASPPAGVRMARVLGANNEDHWGAALHLGDIDNDGIGDLVIGGSIFRDSGSYVSPNDQESGHNDFGASFGGRRNRAGEVYVIYGASEWPAQIDLRTPPANSTRVIGANVRDLLGSQIHSGDLNGDGRTELIIGALQAIAPDNRGRTGAVYIIYGSPLVEGALIDLAALPMQSIAVTTIYGERNLDCGGDSVRSFDINNDGMWDLFIGSPEHTITPPVTGEEREDAGDTKFLFGRPGLLPDVIKLYEPPPPGVPIFRLAGAHGQDQGVDGGDEFSYRLAGGDVDGDGFVDYIANAMHGDGLNNRFTNAGNVYVFSGKKLSARLGMLDDDPEPPPSLTSAALSLNGQAVQQAPVGQSGLRVTVNGTGFRADTEITINDTPVTSRPPEGNPGSTTQRIVELDENVSVRGSAGPLVVRARHTAPSSGFSNAVTAGTLVGPRIDAIRPKRKGSGLLLLRIDGTNLPAGGGVVVLDANGQQVPLKSGRVNSATSATAKIRASVAPPAGAVLRVRVTGAGGIQTNEVATTLP
jgi:hypothetical protein